MSADPDPRDYWTANRLLGERRAAPRTLWAICPTCGTQRTVDLRAVAASGHGDHPVARLKLRCECGALGNAKLTWMNPGRRRENQLIAGKPRPGSFDYATGKMVGHWDP